MGPIQHILQAPGPGARKSGALGRIWASRSGIGSISVTCRMQRPTSSRLAATMSHVVHRAKADWTQRPRRQGRSSTPTRCNAVPVHQDPLLLRVARGEGE